MTQIDNISYHHHLSYPTLLLPPILRSDWWLSPFFLKVFHHTCSIVSTFNSALIQIRIWYMNHFFLKCTLLCEYSIHAGTNNPGVTRKLDNTLKGIRNPIPRNPDNPFKLIQNLLPNIIWIQWPRGLTVPTYNRRKKL